ncbi:hypothetical protein [Actinomadura sp. NEAU-AAG7]|uniref:hypothetical protein n=1 Tax=Actinomadura sp. NEAU-AAG7 TaxID=2839640 RepID=UPI001BE3E57F|nr:hypothetical protein [Actinomadura sp. NEAU-AAG7]MBT2206846.1 hypothetical protein [Actinomadura sp. NEAU-AAG7]
MTTPHPTRPLRGRPDDRPPLPVLLVPLVWGWVCGSCGGGGVASDGTTCPDCHGHGYH